jgi:hypothetical protein
MLKRTKKLVPRTRTSKARTQRARLTAVEIATLTSRFDTKRWDATADADNTAEESARQSEKRVV